MANFTCKRRQKISEQNQNQLQHVLERHSTFIVKSTELLPQVTAQYLRVLTKTNAHKHTTQDADRKY